MTEVALADNVRTLLGIDPEAFQHDAREDAEHLKTLIADGVFDNPQAIIGLEYEFYAVQDPAHPRWTITRDLPTPWLARVPRRMLEFIRFEKELGLHNAEVSTSPLPLNPQGLRAQETEIIAQLRAANTYLRTERMRLVSDGLWTIPPTGETVRNYLTDSVQDNGVRLAVNMSPVPRYHAMANAPGDLRPAMRITAPNVTLQADTVMPESLITSIQPHYQVPTATDLPRYFRYALRFAGPLLALGANTPVFPPDLYDDVPTEQILHDAWLEHRILVFESVLNPANDHPGKVRFPRDIDTVTEAIDRIADDAVLVPMPTDATGRFDDEFGTFRRKHGTYWRWIRPVFDGATRSMANARIEFRPLPAQPTVRDTIAFLAAFSGLMAALPRHPHPASTLDWETAKENFYAGARSGLAADLTWITIDGNTTSDTRELYDDLLNHAASGLRASGCSDETVGRYLGPLWKRVRSRVTPARWKLSRLREALATGTPFEDAIYTVQRDYVNHQKETIVTGDFSMWIDDDAYWDR